MASDLVAATETEDGCRLSESLVKQLTGGDRLRARRMREDFWGFTPSHTVILTTNRRPTIRGTDNGIWRRIRLVPFTVTIPAAEQDSELKKKLESEWPAILRWIVAGCIEWQREGLQAPNEVLAATDNYRADMDVLGEFLKECCLKGAGYQVSAKNLYRTYREWAEARGEYVETQTKFGTRLAEREFSKGYDKGKRVIYLGLVCWGAARRVRRVGSRFRYNGGFFTRKRLIGGNGPTVQNSGNMHINPPERSLNS